MEKHPEKVIERAVRGMLPKTTLGRAQMTSLRSTLVPSIRMPPRTPRRLSWRLKDV